MLFYWFTQALRRIVWLFRPPSKLDIAYIDPSAWCPVCAARDGRLPCVVKVKPGPINKDIPPDMEVFCQHTCNICGARGFEKPVAKQVNPGTVLAAVPRNDLEKSEDRMARLFTSEEQQDVAR